MGARRKARQAAVQMLYQIDLSGAEAADAVELYTQSLIADVEDDPDGRLHFSDARDDVDALAFAKRLVLGCSESRERIDERIRSVSKHWRLERMARVDRNVIRLACHELMDHPDIPPRVSLNEAVELAKLFGDEGAPSFVNGVLDRIASDLDGL